MRLFVEGIGCCPVCGQRNCNCGDIPNYGKDHNIVDASVWGEDPSNFDQNKVAVAMAKTGGGEPHPFTLSNGINKPATKDLNYKDINKRFSLDSEEDSYFGGDKNTYAEEFHF